MVACIAGWAHSPFGKHGSDIESMMVEVATAALDHAGIEPASVDEILVGNYGGAFGRQGFPSSLVLQASDHLRFKPSTRVENACATGSAAIHQGIKSIKAGEARFVLVVGVESMTATPKAQIAEGLLSASYVREEADIEGGFAGVFGVIASQYFEKYGDHSETLARIAAKNHRNGVDNPYAQIRKDLGFEFCNEVTDGNPRVAGPLRRTDCSLVSDGAAALLLTDEATAKSMASGQGSPVRFRSATQVNDFLPMSKRDVLKFDGCREAWRKGLADAGCSLDDLSLVETHDCFTIAELLEYEAMGLAAPGRGGDVVEQGITQRDGRLPVNLSGGLKAKGHPIGATGVSMHVLASMQLSQTAGDMQIDQPELAGIFNMGGVAVANYVSVLEPLG